MALKKLFKFRVTKLTPNLYKSKDRYKAYRSKKRTQAVPRLRKERDKAKLALFCENILNSITVF
jgi:hypothetical protein